MITLACFFGICLGIQTLYFRHQKDTLNKELKESKVRFALTYDLLWMQVRDKNDLTYNDMENLIVSMQQTPEYMPAVRETLAKRITGETNTHKTIGFGK